MKLYVPYNKINPISPEKDDTLIGLAVGTLALGVQPIANAERTYVQYSADDDKIPLAMLDILASKDVIITNLPLFIEIQSKEDESIVPGLNWIEWAAENDTFYEADGRIFIGTNAHTGEDMDWADLQSVRDRLVLPKDLPVIEAK